MHQSHVFSAAHNARDCETGTFTTRQLTDCVLIPVGAQGGNL